MLFPAFSKTGEMLNRFRFPHIFRFVRRLRNAIGYNNGKLAIFLCSTHKNRGGARETLPSLILVKGRGSGYTKANLRGARNRREPNHDEMGGEALPGNRRL